MYFSVKDQPVKIILSQNKIASVREYVHTFSTPFWSETYLFPFAMVNCLEVNICILFEEQTD
jgi:hypothetical protein